MNKEHVNAKMSDIKPYPNNPRKNDDAVESVMKSIEQCGYIAPIIVDEDGVILAGHTRYKALQKLGLDVVDVIIVSGLTDEQKKKYRLLDNKTSELAIWDFDVLTDELKNLDFGDLNLDWNQDDFAKSIKQATENGVKDSEYLDFEEKFKPKLTTDDCFTPEKVYEVVKDWAIKEYGWDSKKIVRPFYPGGNYQKYNYPKDCVVIDNPPFSILSEINQFYIKNNISYFLFAPTLTFFNTSGSCSHVVTDANIIYENGAKVSTSFLCSDGPAVRTAPELRKLIDSVQEDDAAQLPTYNYPANVITSSILAQWCRYGIEYSEDNVVYIKQLDSQKKEKKVIYGGGFFVPTAKAAEAAEAAEAAKAAKAAKAPVIKWKLSDREKKIIAELDNKKD